ncbi:MAG: hypothetical protein MUC88_11040 [Planctomycetes bacterium]|nr:hypothetical protein [Planctomycetota bacterium]
MAVALVALVVFVAACALELYRDHAFICENTGSHKGYRQWRLGFQSGHWYRESRLEQFLRKEHPTDLVNRWTSYEGTGRNILGQPLRFGHAFPGPVFDVPAVFLDRYVEDLDDRAKLDLYHVLVSGSRDQVQSEVTKVWDQVLAQGREIEGEETNRK